MRQFLAIFFLVFISIRFAAAMDNIVPPNDFGETVAEAVPPVINYTALPSLSCTFSGNQVLGVNITDVTGIPLAGANRPRVYYRKNNGSWFSQPGTFVSGTATNSNWNFTIVESDMGGVSGGDIVRYYIIAEDTNSPVNVGASPAAGLVATDVNNVSTHPMSPNNFILRYNLSGTYTVGTGGSFPTLTAAVDAYNNACLLAGPAIFELIDNAYASETYPITINYRSDANSSNTLTIRPSASSTPVFSFATASAQQIINLSGARYINFDGRQAGLGTTKSLNFSSTGTGVAFQLINDAQNNTISYCNISAKRVTNFSGTIAILTAGSGSGNDNNIIDNNDIFDAGGGFSNNGIYSAGTAGKENDNNVVTNNNIYNYFHATNESHGIYINTNSSGWTISGNRLFQSATRVYTGGNFRFGIYIIAGSGYTIANNIIGSSNAAGSGLTKMIGNSVDLPGFPAAYTAAGTPIGLRYIGIGLSLAVPGSPSTVDGNRVENIAMYTSNNTATLSGIFCGIYVESGTVNIGAVSGNIIGSNAGNNSIYVATSVNGGMVTGIRAGCSISSSIQNNIIGAITASGTTTGITPGFTGITVGGPCNYSIRNNSIGNGTPGNIRVGFVVSGGQLSNTGALQPNLPAATGNFRGITCASSLTSITVSNNILQGWITSCPAIGVWGIETSGAHSFGATINVNNNLLGTVAAPWIDATVSNTVFLYGINVTNTSATTHNITGNIFRGSFFGGNNCVGGGLIRLTNAGGNNNNATISGNSFSDLVFNFSTGNLYLIFASYAMSASSRLTIDDNNIVENFSATGNAQYHFVHCGMSSSAGAAVTITNNGFSNVNLATGYSSDVFGLYTSFGGSSANLLVQANTFDDWVAGPGTLALIDIANMTGSASVTANTINNINSQGDIEPISMGTGGASGTFSVSQNGIQNLVSSGAGGYINGIALIIPAVAGNTTQTTISNNICSGFSSPSPTGIITGISLRNGHSSSTVSVRNNKIYDVMGSSAGSRAYGIYQEGSSSGAISYLNNLIGDLRAPISAVPNAAVAGIRVGMIGGSTKLYYNTIHLSASGTATGFSTAAIFADVAVPLELRNNIFSNISVPGVSGRTVSYWRTGANLANYSSSSNNNLYYAGAPSSQRVIFFDGSSSDQTLPAFQSRVAVRDAVSVSVPPAFLSTNGPDNSFLHILPSGNCGITSGGDNSGILIATDFDGESRRTVIPFVTDIGADEASKRIVWTGAVNDDWGNNLNWSGGIVPDDPEQTVVIPSPPAVQPQIGSGDAFQVDNLLFAPGAILTNRGTLGLAGKIAGNPGSINNSPGAVPEGSVKLNGNCGIAQLITGNVFAGNKVKNLTVANNVDISANSGEQVEICGSLLFEGSNRLLKTGDNLTLLSTVQYTANVGNVTGNEVSGKVSVERYINTGLAADGRHAKGWQFLATPASGPSIYESWQENGSNAPGYGTLITGAGSGFDMSTTTPSIKYFNSPANLWTGVTNTSATVANPNGYMIFVRGDRTVTGLSQDAVPTKLRIKGQLYQPVNPPAPVSVQPAQLASVGNPYASAIDISYMRDNGLLVNLDNDVIVWDPLLYGSYNYGGYQTLSAANDYEPTAGSTASAYYPAGVPSPLIQSGQAFFVRSSGNAGSVNFSENVKAAGSRLVNRLSSDKQYFRAALYTDAGIIADGNAAIFARRYQDRIDADDSRKLDNSGENFCLVRQNVRLAVEARKSISEADTLFYELSNVRQRSYQLRFSPKNLQSTRLNAYLVDRFLGSESLLSLHDSSIVSFEVTTDPMSSRRDRFFVVFKKTARSNNLHAITQMADHRRIENADDKFSGARIGVYPNPVVNKEINLYFHHQKPGTYRVELINLAGQSLLSKEIRLATGNEVMSISPATKPASGNYHLKVTPLTGEPTIVKLLIP